MIIIDCMPRKGETMDLMDVEMILLGIAVILSYFLPAMLWLFHLYDRARLSKIGSEQEYKKIVWFSKHKELITLSQIKLELINKGKKAKKRLHILFVIVLPAICFLMNTILIKHIGRFYIKRKFDLDLPPTNMAIYVETLVLLSGWTVLVLINKLLVFRINDFLKKADELEASSVAK